MSIIYEALKKVEHKFRLPEAKKEQDKLFLWSAIAAIFLGFVGSGVAAVLLFSSLAKPVQIIQQTTPALIRSDPYPAHPTSLPTPAFPIQLPNPIIPVRQKVADTLDLKGIMDSEGEKIALINSEILRVGDYINGARVIRITKNSVELVLKDKIIILKIK